MSPLSPPVSPEVFVLALKLPPSPTTRRFCTGCKFSKPLEQIFRERLEQPRGGVYHVCRRMGAEESSTGIKREFRDSLVLP